ncbi:hypothetical protein, partial [Mesorhizobium sp. M2E.F.Ca.ET.209.01.1.1]|uniref:hypothetical protein n=1 Tax=Mesorhizobium sp. M2E.F.Ca.ET.209.01.1.1 TaxID=2500526 RepID=UPI001AED55A4
QAAWPHAGSTPLAICGSAAIVDMQLRCNPICSCAAIVDMRRCRNDGHAGCAAVLIIGLKGRVGNEKFEPANI